MKYFSYLFFLPYVMAVVLPIVLYSRWHSNVSRRGLFFFASLFGGLGSFAAARVVEAFLYFPLIRLDGPEVNPTYVAGHAVGLWFLLVFEVVFITGCTYLLMQKLRTALATAKDQYESAEKQKT